MFLNQQVFYEKTPVNICLFHLGLALLNPGFLSTVGGTFPELSNYDRISKLCVRKFLQALSIQIVHIRVKLQYKDINVFKMQPSRANPSSLCTDSPQFSYLGLISLLGRHIHHLNYLKIGQYGYFRKNNNFYVHFAT